MTIYNLTEEIPKGVCKICHVRVALVTGRTGRRILVTAESGRRHAGECVAPFAQADIPPEPGVQLELAL